MVRGVPITTLDIDIVHLRSQENITRLGDALAELGAWYREHPDRKPGPELGLMLGPGHHLFMSRLGPLDVLGETVGGSIYEDLDKQSDTFELEPGLRVRVLNLRELVRIKETLFRDKDKLTLAVLRQVLKDDERGA